MINNENIYVKLKYLLSLNNKKFLIILVFMSMLLSIIEAIGITAIMPFISTAANPNLIHTNQYYNTIFQYFEFKDNNEFVIYFGIGLIIFYIFRAVYITINNYFVAHFSMKNYVTYVNKLFENYLHMPYSIFVKKNSASISKTMIVEALQLSYLMQNILLFISEIIIILILYGLLLIVDIKMTLILTVIMGIKVIFLTKTISKKIKEIGKQRAIVQERFSKMINESLGNFKVIKFIGNQKSLQKKFLSSSSKFADIQTLNVSLATIPRNLLEAIGFSILISVVLYIVAFNGSVTDVIPVLSMYALALYRILPATSRILNSYNSIVFYLPSLDIVYNDLTVKYEQECERNIHFDENIEIKNIYFNYDKKVKIIDNLTLEIKKGQKIAFIGESGSGKSTLVDLICGIYRPDSGEILIDGVKLDNSNIVSWRKKIGYIPQDIYLFDGTIADNISFGREYDEAKIITVLKQANIYDTLVKKDGLDTMVGEGGIQLSGGQKQRIGIARALYGDPEILVLDEATSALDTQTEKAIMDEIYKISEDKTLMIIAHRLSTIEKCDIKINLDKVNKK